MDHKDVICRILRYNRKKQCWDPLDKAIWDSHPENIQEKISFSCLNSSPGPDMAQKGPNPMTYIMQKLMKHAQHDFQNIFATME